MDVAQNQDGRVIKIAVDARLLSRPLSGIGRYTLHMCRALSKFSDVSLCLYSPASISDEIIIQLKTGIYRTRTYKNVILRQLWSETHLPLWAKKDEVDVLWGPAHRLPRWIPKNIGRVVTIHDLVWKFAGDTMKPLSRWLEYYQMPPAVRAADRIVTDSQTIADAVINEFCVNPDKLAVVPLATTLANKTPDLEALHELGISRPYVLFVGTHEPRKNLMRLITAYSRVGASLRDNNLLVIVGGKGWGGTNPRQIAADLGLENNVRVVGFVSDATLAALYVKALCLVLPSIYEGFGLPLVEAMSYGIPILTSNNSAMPEVAGDAALLIDPLDVDSIKLGLTHIMIDENMRNRLATNARKNSERFNWNTSAEKLVDIFKDSVVARRKH
jgi:glycosyltransferase involved in cell wall biosynthesis